MEQAERMMNEMKRDFERIYVGERAGSRSVGRLRKGWINTVKACLKKKRGVNVRQGRRMVHDKSELAGVYEGKCVGRSRTMNH